MVRVVDAEGLAAAVLAEQVVNVAAVAYNAPADLFQGADREFSASAHPDSPLVESRNYCPPEDAV